MNNRVGGGVAPFRLSQHRTCGSAYGVSFKQSPWTTDCTIRAERTRHWGLLFAYAAPERCTTVLARYRRISMH